MSHYQVLDVPANIPCENCNPCMRMRLMEMGFIQGQEIDVKEKMKGMFIVDMLTEDGIIEQTIALRKNELGRICMKEI